MTKYCPRCGYTKSKKEFSKKQPPKMDYNLTVRNVIVSTTKYGIWNLRQKLDEVNIS
jgi:hypothetical protein